MNKAHPARGPPCPFIFPTTDQLSTQQLLFGETIMETLEKLELRKEISDEIREELTRSNGKLITRRVLCAAAIIILEIIIWILIARCVVRFEDTSDGLFAAWFVTMLRMGQIFAAAIFSEE